MYSIQLPSTQCGVSSLATASQVRPVRTLKVGLSDTSTFAESTCSTDVAVVTSEFRADEGICDGGFSDIGSTRNDGAPLIDTFVILAVVPTSAIEDDNIENTSRFDRAELATALEHNEEHFKQPYLLQCLLASFLVGVSLNSCPGALQEYTLNYLVAVCHWLCGR